MKPPNPGSPNLTPLLIFLISVNKTTIHSVAHTKNSEVIFYFFSLHPTGRESTGKCYWLYLQSYIQNQFTSHHLHFHQACPGHHPSLSWMTVISLLTSLSTSALSSLKYFTSGKIKKTYTVILLKHKPEHISLCSKPILHSHIIQSKLLQRPVS